jgi:hypothetical protein
MPNIFQIRTIHSGFPGAPGYTQHYFDASGSTLGPQAASDAVRTFWEAVYNQFAQGCTYSIQADVEVLDDSTGHLASVEATTPLTQSIGSGSGNYAGGVGAVCKWVTNSVHGTRRLTGRTFLVPLNANAYENNGTLGGITLSQFRAAALALVTQQDFGVWGRPVDGANGLFANATASNVRDHVAWLSSRRD